MMLEIGPRLLYALIIAAGAFVTDSLFKFMACSIPIHEIHEERITEVENPHAT